MKRELVSTGNTVRITDAANAIEQRRHDPEISGIGLIWGHPGLGKTETIRKYHADKRRDQAIRCFWTRASVTWSDAAMLNALLQCMGMQPNVYRKDAMRQQLIDALRPAFAIFLIDELDAIVEHRRMISLIKEIHDESGCGFLLVGEERVDSFLKRYVSFYNRINKSAFVNVKGHTLEDVTNVIRVRCEWPVDADVCKEIHRLYGARSMRSVIDTIRSMEAFARNNKIETITMAAYKRSTGVRSIEPVRRPLVDQTQEAVNG